MGSIKGCFFERTPNYESLYFQLCMLTVETLTISVPYYIGNVN